MAELLRSLLFVYTAVHTQEVRHNHRKCSKNFVHNSFTPTVDPACSGGIFDLGMGWKFFVELFLTTKIVTFY